MNVGYEAIGPLGSGQRHPPRPTVGELWRRIAPAWAVWTVVPPAAAGARGLPRGANSGPNVPAAEILGPPWPLSAAGGLAAQSL